MSYRERPCQGGERLRRKNGQKLSQVGVGLSSHSLSTEGSPGDKVSAPSRPRAVCPGGRVPRGPCARRGSCVPGASGERAALVISSQGQSASAIAASSGLNRAKCLQFSPISAHAHCCLETLSLSFYRTVSWIFLTIFHTFFCRYCRATAGVSHPHPNPKGRYFLRPAGFRP